MERTKVIRRLRIAMSAVCGILCVLLIVFWVRSYHKKDDCRGMVGKTLLNIQSSRGELGIARWIAWQSNPIPWHMSSESVDESTERLWQPMIDRMPLSMAGIRRQRFTPDMTLLAIQFRLLVLLSSTLAAVPWLRWKYSLRTLLIALTLIALVLGLVVFVLVQREMEFWLRGVS